MKITLPGSTRTAALGGLTALLVGTALRAEQRTVRASFTPGAYACFYTVRGHAQGGIVGRVEVK